MDEQAGDRSSLKSSLKHQEQARTSLPDENMAGQCAPEIRSHDEMVICDDCRAVDWSSLPLETTNMELRSLNTPFEELRDSSCRICAILSTIKPHDLEGEGFVLKCLPLSRQVGYTGAAHIEHRHTSSISRCSVLGVFEEDDREQDCVTGKRLAVLNSDDLGCRTITPSSIDYNNLKDLVRICEEEHSRCCATDSSPNVLGLKVINTKTWEVIKAPDQCKYLTLSYVWGKKEGEGSSRDIQNAPPVIKDAISVTNAMGYNYLWVDRYCITDPNEKAHMISQMYQIYANAAITIIAATDGDTNMGLSGVSRPRQPQRRVVIHDTALLELPYGPEDLESSKWTSRGWTYQEGYLASRRLIFTKTQVLFLCNGMYAEESLQRLSNTTFYTNDFMEFTNLIPTSEGVQRIFWVQELLSQLREYSRRELTHSSDSLNAFLGILRYYTRKSAELTSPVLQLPWGLITNKHPKRDAFILHLLWYHDHPAAARRTEFPSWSWTGWAGPLLPFGPKIILRPGHEVEEGPFSYLDWNLSFLETEDRYVELYDLALKEYEAREDPYYLYQPGPKRLQITCLTIPVSFQEVNLKDDQKQHKTEITIHDTGKVFRVDRNSSSGFHPILQVWEGIYVGNVRGQDWGLRLDQQVEQQDDILGLIFAQRNEKNDWTDYYCLLVRQLGDGLYERVGLLMLNGLDLDPHGPKGEDSSDQVEDQMVYLDANGRVLDKFEISDGQRRYLFTETAEKRTICLV